MYAEWERASARVMLLAAAAADIASNKKFYACEIYVGYVQPVAVQQTEAVHTQHTGKQQPVAVAAA